MVTIAKDKEYCTCVMNITPMSVVVDFALLNAGGKEFILMKLLTTEILSHAVQKKSNKHKL